MPTAAGQTTPHDTAEPGVDRHPAQRQRRDRGVAATAEEGEAARGLELRVEAPVDPLPPVRAELRGRLHLPRPLAAQPLPRPGEDQPHARDAHGRRPGAAPEPDQAARAQRRSPTTSAYRQVTVTGHYDNATRSSSRWSRTPQLDPGYWLVTPLILSDGSAVAINRGFVPLGLDESGPLLQYRPPSGTVTVTGMLYPTQNRTGGPVRPGQGSPPPAVPRRPAPLAAPGAVHAVSALREPGHVVRPAQHGNYPEPVPLPTLDDGPHLNYAGQWAIFATLTLIVYPLLLRRVARNRMVVEDDERADGRRPVRVTAPEARPCAGPRHPHPDPRCRRRLRRAVGSGQDQPRGRRHRGRGVEGDRLPLVRGRARPGHLRGRRLGDRALPHRPGRGGRARARPRGQAGTRAGLGPSRHRGAHAAPADPRHRARAAAARAAEHDPGDDHAGAGLSRRAART